LLPYGDLKAKLKVTRRIDADTDDAILQAIERGKTDIVVMGVSRRPGDAAKSTPKGGERAPAEGVS
jgi:hypothetical protein